MNLFLTYFHCLILFVLLITPYTTWSAPPWLINTEDPDASEVFELPHLSTVSGIYHGLAGRGCYFGTLYPKIKPVRDACVAAETALSWHCDLLNNRPYGPAVAQLCASIQQGLSLDSCAERHPEATLAEIPFREICLGVKLGITAEILERCETLPENSVQRHSCEATDEAKLGSIPHLTLIDRSRESAETKTLPIATLAPTSTIAREQEESLLHELQGLPSGATLEERFTSHLSREQIASALIARRHQTRDHRLVSAHEFQFESSYSFYENSSVFVAFADNYVEKIQTNGRIRNYSEEGQSGANVGGIGPNRLQMEEDVLDINLGGTLGRPEHPYSKFLRPVYGFFNFDAEQILPPLSSLLPLSITSTQRAELLDSIRPTFNVGYGNVFAQLNMKKVRDRVTFFPGDTGNDYRPSAIFTLLHQLKSILRKDFFEYYEAQIWGGVGLEDIDAFLVTHIHPRRLQKLATLGKPIYQAEFEYRQRTGARDPKSDKLMYQLTRGKLMEVSK